MAGRSATIPANRASSLTAAPQFAAAPTCGCWSRRRRFQPIMMTPPGGPRAEIPADDGGFAIAKFALERHRLR